MTLLPFRLLPVPVGGLYFRVLPRPILRRALAAHRRRGEAVASYHHPYDIDTEQSFTHAGFRRWGPFDLLMRANRGAVLPRLEMASVAGLLLRRLRILMRGGSAKRLRAGRGDG